jgi:ethanolamine ammonia-lyase small subunit
VTRKRQPDKAPPPPPDDPPPGAPGPGDPWLGDPWPQLRRLTTARIGLARSGASLATAPLLELRLAHARARDAVHAPFDTARVVRALEGLGEPVLSIASVAPDRQLYLMRPDLGRSLAADAAAVLSPHAGGHDVVFVVSDGLSAGAVTAHAEPVLARALPRLRAGRWAIAPLVVVRHGRVAIGDAIARALRAQIAVVLIGERPGLSSPDSMGAYFTWQPTAQTTDADRNCISNIRPEGLGYADAAGKLVHLLHAIRARRLSGVRLKDDGDRLSIGDC